MHSGGSSGSGPAKKARVEIIPLIDVIMFLLATFVLFTLSMNKQQGAQVNLPTSSTSIARDPKDAVTISVTNTGELYWDKEQISWDMFLIRLLNYREERRTANLEPKIIINFDKDASFGQAMSVLDEIRKAELQKVLIDTRYVQAGS